MTTVQRKALGAFAVLALTFGAGAYVGFSDKFHTAADAQTMFRFGAAATQPADVDMTQFWEAYQLLNENFVVTHASSSFPNKEEQLYGAIAGLTASFDDPYTVFLPPSDAQIFQEDISGSFGGVGMEIDNTADGNLIVVAPLKGSPAEKAGIKRGDIVLMIGTTTAQGIPSDEAVKIIRGPIGTSVKLQILHQGEQKPVWISIVRDTINIPIIDSGDIGNGIYKISLYSFSQNSADLFRSALRAFIQSGDHKLILDLRGNPGGYLDAAVDMASYFLPVGAPVVTEDFKGKQNNIVHRSVGYNVFAKDSQFKMAVLIDQGSASASEILAGALQQNNVAKLVGTRSFGKGSVQELMDLGGGAELKITIARWLTPNGSSISDGGLKADIQATTTAEVAKDPNKDPQTLAAVKYLLGK
jgi:carboxyl-terminal processing protease